MRSNPFIFFKGVSNNYYFLSRSLIYTIVINTEKEISLVSKEIERLNKQKEKAIIDAMESEEKSVSNNIRKPKLFNKITKFFVSRFNTAKIIQNTIIAPLNLKIENFRTNELANMKG